LSNEQIEKDVYKMVVRQEEAARSAAPGQFVNLYTKSQSMLLPRPISICEIGEDTLTLVYGVVGKGTLEFSSQHSCTSGWRNRCTTSCRTCKTRTR
ncbi:MAG: hypothetical protein RR448_06470, partial [Niameybacter sp.]